MKKNIILSIGIMAGILLLTGCQKELSDEYVTVKEYKGLEVEKVEVKQAADEDVQDVIDLMLKSYANNELGDSGAVPELTDELASKFAGKKTTAAQYKKEIKAKIQAKNEETAQTEMETKVWEQVMDHTEVKEYPKKRLGEIEASLKKQYEVTAEQNGMTYAEYIESLSKTEEEMAVDITEAAESALKQELAAELIGQQHNLKPTDADYEKAVEEYVEEFKFANRKELEAVVPEDELRAMVVQDRVKGWLLENCKQK